MIIDIHTHAWPEKVAQKARENLETIFKVKLVGAPTVDTLLKFMQKNQIDISVVCGVAVRAELVPAINDWLFSVRSKKIKAFCAMHPEYALWKEELKRIKENADGIKFQPEFQNFYVDDERLYPIYEEISNLNLPILFHCGEELSGTMQVRSSPPRILKIKEAFPDLKIIAAHFGGFKFWDEVKKHLLGRDIYLDTSFFFDYLPKEEIVSLLSNHRKDRLLFGTDFPLIDQKKDIDFLKSLKLGKDLKEKIFYHNASEILKLN